MTQHQRFADDEVGDPAVVEVVHVRAADPHRGDLDQHLVGTRFGHRRRLDGHLSGTDQKRLGLLARQ